MVEGEGDALERLESSSSRWKKKFRYECEREGGRGGERETDIREKFMCDGREFCRARKIKEREREELYA